jgi:hypothetical protein
LKKLDTKKERKKERKKEKNLDRSLILASINGKGIQLFKSEITFTKVIPLVAPSVVKFVVKFELHKLLFDFPTKLNC